MQREIQEVGERKPHLGDGDDDEFLGVYIELQPQLYAFFFLKYDGGEGSMQPLCLLFKLSARKYSIFNQTVFYRRFSLSFDQAEVQENLLGDDDDDDDDGFLRYSWQYVKLLGFSEYCKVLSQHDVFFELFFYHMNDVFRI